jgi:hypothetical protein
MSKSEPAAHALQRDLFTNQWEFKRPKRGSGSHVRLTKLVDEKAALAGMASFSGEGPAGKYCKDCAHFGGVAVQRGPDAIETNPAGCALYAQRVGHAAPTSRRDIRFFASCRHFNMPADDRARHFVIDQSGAVHPVEKFPADLRRWRPGDAEPLGQPPVA